MNQHHLHHILSIFCCAGIALIGGCVVGPNYAAPEIRIPIGFDSTSSNASTAAATQPSALGVQKPVDLQVWWKSLGDAELDSLVNRAVTANYNLRIAVARLQQSREIEFAFGGGAVPGIGGTNGVNVVGAAGRSSGNNATRGRLTGPVYSGTNTAGLQEITHVVGFDAGWELDLFGRYTRVVEANSADTQAVGEFLNDVLIAVVADVVRSYIDVRSLQLRLEIARENAASQQRTAELIRVRFKRGLTSELDAVLAERQLSTTLARIAPLQASIAAAQRRVAILCGLYPEELRAELDRPASLPGLPPAVAPGMPIELLRRRPDIRQAERHLAAATARIGIATANLFPRVSITGGAGLQGQGLGRSPVENSLVWSVGPSFYWPFIDFGTLDALVKVQNYQAREVLWTYQKTVITAVAEVDNSLSDYVAQQDSLSHLSVAVEASRKAVHISTQRYQDGLNDFLNVLDAQRQLYDLEDQYAASQQTVIYDFIALYKALGGGWEGFEGPPPAIKPMPAILAAGAETFGKPGKIPVNP